MKRKPIKKRSKSSLERYGYVIIATPKNPFDKKNIKETINRIMETVK